jgi:hypothetical protein
MNVLSVASAIGSMKIEDFNRSARALYPNLDDYGIWQLKRNLTALGHIHIDYDSRRVQVCAPWLCILPSSHDGTINAVLAGARNEQFVSQLQKHAGENHVSIDRTRNGDLYPDHIVLTGEATAIERIGDAIEQLYSGLGDARAEPGCWRLLHAVRSLADRLGSHYAEKMPVGAGSGIDDWEVFLPGTTRFSRWSEIRESYSNHLMLVRRSIYSHWLARRKSDDSWEYWQNRFQGDPLWAKWAVAQSPQVAQDLFSEPGDDSFRIPAWLPLPLDLHRVCCLCTGQLPSEDSCRISYNGIPEIIRAVIRRKLFLLAVNHPN